MKLNFKNSIAFLFFFLSNFFINAQDIDFNWEKIVGGTHWTHGTCVKTDSEGNVYASGVYRDTLTIADTTIFSHGSDGAYLVKLTNDGDLIWIKNYVSSFISNISIPSIAVDTSGGIAVGVFYKKILEADTIIYTNNSDTIYSKNMCLFHYLSNGTLDWKRNTGGTNETYVDGVSMVYDTNNYLYISGTSIDIQFFDTSIVVNTLDSTYETGWSPGGPYNYWNYFHPVKQYLAKYDIAGQKLWIKNIGGYTTDICVDINNNVLLCGNYKGNVRFDSVNLSTAGSEIFIAKYNSSGTMVWVKYTTGSTNNNGASAIRTDFAGNVYIGGGICGSNISFNGLVNIPFVCTDAFLAKYSASGVFQWMRDFGVTMTTADYFHQQSVSGIDIDYLNRLVIVGSFSNYLDTLSLGSGVKMMATYGGPDGFVARFDLNGNVIDYGRYSNPGSIIMQEVCTDSEGNIFITGQNNLSYLSSDDPSFSYIAKIYGDNVLSTEQISTLRENISIFPNPSNDIVFIKYKVGETAHIRMLDLNGSILLEKSNTPSTFSIDLKGFAKGPYILEIITKNVTERTLFIVQ